MHSAASKLGNADGLEASIVSATQGLLDDRQADGHWVFELEADCTIPAEYVLLAHYLGRTGRYDSGSQDRQLPAAGSGRPWRLAAGP